MQDRGAKSQVGVVERMAIHITQSGTDHRTVFCSTIYQSALFVTSLQGSPQLSDVSCEGTSNRMSPEMAHAIQATSLLQKICSNFYFILSNGKCNSEINYKTAYILANSLVYNGRTLFTKILAHQGARTRVLFIFDEIPLLL